MRRCRAIRVVKEGRVSLAEGRGWVKGSPIGSTVISGPATGLVGLDPGTPEGSVEASHSIRRMPLASTTIHIDKDTAMQIDLHHIPDAEIAN